jgi:hypothetical protein
MRVVRATIDREATKPFVRIGQGTVVQPQPVATLPAGHKQDGRALDILQQELPLGFLLIDVAQN